MPPSSSGLGRRPFKAETRVQIPLGVRNANPGRHRSGCRHRSGEHQGKIGIHGPVVQFGVHAGLSSRRPRVQIPSGPPTKREAYSRVSHKTLARNGRVAQSVERPPEKRKVPGSIPGPTTKMFCETSRARTSDGELVKHRFLYVYLCIFV